MVGARDSSVCFCFGHNVDLYNHIYNTERQASCEIIKIHANTSHLSHSHNNSRDQLDLEAPQDPLGLLEPQVFEERRDQMDPQALWDRRGSVVCRDHQEFPVNRENQAETAIQDQQVSVCSKTDVITEFSPPYLISQLL